MNKKDLSPSTPSKNDIDSSVRAHSGCDVLCIGQVLMDCIIKGWDSSALTGRVQTADSVTLSPGGDAFNESVILSRLGHNVRTVCVLGRDLAGDVLEDLLLRNHIDTHGIIRETSARTPVAPLLVNGTGDRKSINAVPCLEKFLRLDDSLFQGVKVVSLASLFRAPLTDAEMILNICKRAKSAGAIVTADTKLPLKSSVELEDMKMFLPYIDYIFPNEFEAEYYTRGKINSGINNAADACAASENRPAPGAADYEAMADIFLGHGVKNVIIKAGEKGCYAKNRNGLFHIPAYPLSSFGLKAVDSTGAGDNFVAGFISSLLYGSTFTEALEFATSCAAVCVQSVGAVTGVRNREQVKKVQDQFR